MNASIDSEMWISTLKRKKIEAQYRGKSRDIDELAQICWKLFFEVPGTWPWIKRSSPGNNGSCHASQISGVAESIFLELLVCCSYGQVSPSKVFIIFVKLCWRAENQNNQSFVLNGVSGFLKSAEWFFLKLAMSLYVGGLDLVAYSPLIANISAAVWLPSCGGRIDMMLMQWKIKQPAFLFLTYFS